MPNGTNIRRQPVHANQPSVSQLPPAGQPSSPKAAAPSRRMPRREAAARLSNLLGVPVAPKTLERMPVPYLKIGRSASYTDADIDAHAARVLASAPRQMSGSTRRSG